MADKLRMKGFTIYNADFVSKTAPPVVVVIERYKVDQAFVLDSMVALDGLLAAYEIYLTDKESATVEPNNYFDDSMGVEVYTAEGYVTLLVQEAESMEGAEREEQLYIAEEVKHIMTPGKRKERVEQFLKEIRREEEPSEWARRLHQ